MPVQHLYSIWSGRSASLPLTRTSISTSSSTANCPQTIRNLDEKRLQQIVLNLLSNSSVQVHPSKGSVTLGVRCATSGWSPTHPVLSKAERAIEIKVTDTGIGILEDKQKLIFEAFRRRTAPPAASTAGRASACRSAARSAWARSAASSR